VDDGVDEARRIVIRQDFQTNQAGSQSCCVNQFQAADCRRVAQRAAVPKNGQRLCEAQRDRIEAPHTGDYPAPDALKTANQQLRRIELGQMPVVELDRRPQQLG